jgi:hypothetical protein
VDRRDALALRLHGLVCRAFQDARLHKHLARPISPLAWKRRFRRLNPDAPRQPVSVAALAF